MQLSIEKRKILQILPSQNTLRLNHNACHNRSYVTSEVFKWKIVDLKTLQYVVSDFIVL